MHAVIMAGGSGTRFWPYSRNNRPKQFLKMVGDKAMLIQTCDRLRPIISDEEIIIILGQNHLREAKRVLKGRKVHMLAEPIGRNTAPCIGLGAIYARFLGCKGAIAFLPADHYIADPAAFTMAVGQAGKLAESGGIVTIGIMPSRPETGYGYIKRALSDRKDHPFFKVSSFVEKPGLKKARAYLASGDYFWNAGIFVATHETILNEIRLHLPDLYKGLLSLEKVMGTGSFEKRLAAVYKGLESISFDYGIMEKTGSPAFVIPCDCGWSDVGSWESLHELRLGDNKDPGNVSEGESILIDCKNSLVSGMSGRLVACLGVKNCVIVDTDDALLVADLKKSQDIRKIVEFLKRNKMEGLL
jgi:mannose-1-phosphate guanylyltransferase/mannose-6-phosphate isomerase